MPKTKPWFVYLLECKDGRLYTGISTDVPRRLAAHSKGKGAKFTRRNPPSHLIGTIACASRSEASKLEWVIKQLKPQQKRARILQKTPMPRISGKL